MFGIRKKNSDHKQMETDQTLISKQHEVCEKKGMVCNEWSWSWWWWWWKNQHTLMKGNII